MTSDRIEEIQKQTAYPDSQSVTNALLTVWNEVAFGLNNRKCINCKFYGQFKDTTSGDCYGPRDKSDTSECSDNFGCIDWQTKD